MAQTLKHTKPKQLATKGFDSSQRRLLERPEVTENLLADMTRRIVKETPDEQES